MPVVIARDKKTPAQAGSGPRSVIALMLVLTVSSGAIAYFGYKSHWGHPLTPHQQILADQAQQRREALEHPQREHKRSVRQTSVPVSPVHGHPRALMGTWYSHDAWIIEGGKGATTWTISQDGTYNISVKGVQETEDGQWEADDTRLVRIHDGVVLSFPYVLGSGNTSLTYDNQAIFRRQ